MQPFNYSRPANLDEARALLQSGADCMPLAGGQSLLAAMKMGLMQPEQLLDLQAIPELRGIALQANGRLRIGAMTTHAQLAASSELAAFAPGLCGLAGHIADAQIRNRGTVGGSAANYDPAACWPAGLLAANAVMHTDRRAICVDDFFVDLFTTVLAAGELLVSVELPRPQRLAYVKFEQAASRFALVGVAVAQFVGSVRVAVTGTANGVVRLPDFEAALARDFSVAAIARLTVDAAMMGSDIHAQADYRAHLAALGVLRAVQKALGG